MKIIKHTPRHSTHPVFPDTIFPSMDELFDPFSWLMTPVSDRRSVMPDINISEDDKEVRVEASVPGYNPEQIEVELDQDSIVIRGSMNDQREEKGKTWHRQECMSGKFQRQISLPSYINADKATSKIKNGLLTIILPKEKDYKQKIKVEIEK